MKRLKAIFTRTFPDALGPLPGGQYLVPAFYLLTTLFLNAALIYSLVSGKIQRTRWFEWLEARDSSPALYWCYVAGLLIVVLFLDGYLAYGVWRFTRDAKKA